MGYLVEIAAAAVLLLQTLLSHQWRDRRTKRHRVALRALLAAVFLLLFVSALNTWSDASHRQSLKRQLSAAEVAAKQREKAAAQERAAHQHELHAVRSLLEPFLEYASEHYPSDDSSDALSKVLRDLQTHDRQIAELKLKAHTIRTFELRVTIETVTPERPVESMRPSLAVSVVGLATTNDSLLRFETGRVMTGQPSPTVGRIAFAYRPEEPVAILGRQINHLRTVKKFQANYQELFRMFGFAVGPRGAQLTLDVLVNGVLVGKIVSHMPLESLQSGDMALDVSDAFQTVPELYTQQVNRRATTP